MALEKQLTGTRAEFTLTVHGVSAHGSTPNKGRDAIVAASAIVLDLQGLVSRFNDPLDPLVVTVGSVRSGTQFNIIADTAVLEGTVTAPDNAVLEAVGERLRRTAVAGAEAWGCTADVDYRCLGAKGA